jgi:hypothetical protein
MPAVREGSRLRPPQSIREKKVKEVSDLFHHQAQVAYPGGEAAVAAHSYSTIRPGIGLHPFFKLRSLRFIPQVYMLMPATACL